MGTRFAKAIECRLKCEPIPKFDQITDAIVERFLAAASAYFPQDSHPQIHAERKIDFLLADTPARMIGYIDVLDLSGPVARVRDHKTRSDKRYAPTHERLASDLQLNIYAYAMRQEGLDSVSIGHINYIKPPKAKATNLPYLLNEWQPEVFLREIPLDGDLNETIMEGVKTEVREMARYADPLLDAKQVPIDYTGEACFSYGQPCPYSSICPKFSLRPTSATMTKNFPPPPPSRNAAAAPQAAVNLPPAPPVRAANLPPAPPARPANLPPLPPRAAVNLPPAAPPAAPAAPPAPPAPQPASGGINPPAVGLMPSMPLGNIPNLTAAAKAWLHEQGFTTSVQVAHLTEAYLAGFRPRKAVASELAKVADILRGLHGIDTPDPFENCPSGTPSEASSPAEMLADLPDLPADAAESAKGGEGAPSEEPEAVTDANTPKRRGRPPKSVTPATQATAVPLYTPVTEASQRSAAVPADGAPPYYLYLECFPIKGGDFVTLEDFLAPVFREIERVAGVRSWRSITEFGRFNEMLHLAVADVIAGRAVEVQMPRHLVVLSIYTEYAKAILDLLIQHAALVVRK